MDSTEVANPAAAPAVAERSRPPQRFYVLGSRVDRVAAADVLWRARIALRAGRPQHIVTTNTLMLLEARRDSALREIIENAFLSIPESWGVGWASGFAGQRLTGTVPGIDLADMLCSLAAVDEHSVYLLGGKPGVSDDAARDLVRRYPKLRIVGTQHGYGTDDPSVLEQIRASKPTILLVGMGMPQQEKWIAKNLQWTGACIAMGVGGSFDVWSGRLSRAPGWMRALEIEWMYRLAQEPWRWKRILQLPLFMWDVFWDSRL